jgi:hypothetical protein
MNIANHPPGRQDIFPEIFSPYLTESERPPTPHNTPPVSLQRKDTTWRGTTSNATPAVGRRPSLDGADRADEKGGRREEIFFRRSDFSRRNDPARNPPKALLDKSRGGLGRPPPENIPVSSDSA